MCVCVMFTCVSICVCGVGSVQFIYVNILTMHIVHMLG